MADFSFAFLALGVVLLFIVLAHLFGSYTQDPRLMAWSQEELKQWIYSLILLVILMTTSGLLDSIFSYFIGSQTTPLNYVISYLLKMAYYIREKFITLSAASYFLQFMGGVPARSGGISVEIMQGVIPATTAIKIYLGLYLFFFTGIWAQLLIFSFLEFLSIQLLLPIGIGLRVIPQTRRAGATLIGLAFGLYFGLPLIYSAVLMAVEEAFGGSQVLQDLTQESRISFWKVVPHFIHTTYRLIAEQSLRAVGEDPRKVTTVVEILLLLMSLVGGGALSVALRSSILKAVLGTTMSDLFMFPAFLIALATTVEIVLRYVLPTAIVSVTAPTVIRAITNFFERMMA